MKRVLLGLFLLALATVTAGALLARGPDFTIGFEREVSSPLAPEAIAQRLADVPSWPEWHFQSQGASVEGGGPLRAGSPIALTLVPRGYSWRKYTLHTLVEEWDPKSGFKLRLTRDEQGKLAALFSDLSWAVRVEPAPGGGSKLTGTLEARTTSGRARFFGRLAPRIFLNQVFYPNLFALAGQSDVSGIELSPKR